MEAKNYKQIIIAKLNELLNPLDFKRNNSTYTISNGDLTYFINLQSSNGSTKTSLKVTLNLEITSAILYRLQDTSMPEKSVRHFTKRIGSYTDQKHDKWWVIETVQAAETAASEICILLSQKVLPEFAALKTTSDLRQLWKDGKYSGLTPLQRKEYLELLAAQQ